VVVHGSYLINLTSPHQEELRKSREVFLDEIHRADILGVSYFVFYPGSYKGKGEREGSRRMAESLNRILEKALGLRVQLLLETTSGQGNQIGYRFEHLEEIISQVEQKERLGVCFDTAHVFASGYDLRNSETYYETFQQFDETIGLEKL
jgi:apurinic endonuclease APN1